MLASRRPAAQEAIDLFVYRIGRELVEASAWQGIVAPAKTPAEIVAKLNSQNGAALADMGVRQKLQAAAVEPLQSTPESFAA